MRNRSRLVATLWGAAVLSLPAVASAHGDVALIDEQFELRAGASRSVEGDLHYHRLVGRFEATDLIEVVLVEVDTGASVLAAGPATTIVFNHLVACCDDRAWSLHRLEIRNVGGTDIAVGARARLVHDDVAVMVYRAESGTAESVVVLGAIWSLILVRAARRARPASERQATASFVGVAATVLALALYGTARYGSGGVPAVVGALNDIPVLPANPVVSRASLLLGVAMIAWAMTALRWVRAASLMPRRRWLVLGAAVVGAPVAVGVLVAEAYLTTGMPAAMVVAAAVPVVAVATRARVQASAHEAQEMAST